MATIAYGNTLYKVPDNCTVYVSPTTTWNSWCNSPATTMTVSSSNTVWANWCTINVTSATSNTVWINWVNTTSGTASNVTGNVVHFVSAQRPTPEQIATAERVAAERAEEERKRKVALAKSMEWLRSNISQRQREMLDKHGWFLVEGGKSKKTYRINADRCAGNVYELNDQHKEIARYCVHASYEFPLGDQLLAQAISLRLDEEHIIGRANRTALAA